MLRSAFCIASLALPLLCSAAKPAARTLPVAEVHDLAHAFAAFWDRAQMLPIAQRVGLFKKEIVPLFPAFYGIARYGGERTQAQQDERIRRAIETFPQIRSEYLRKADQFRLELPRHTASFRARFPDYRPTSPIYFLHSLGEMDAGPRDLDGHNALIFGIDNMVRDHGSGKENAFFHHELFHIFHQPSISACSGEAVWTKLWTEGLATYVSHVMNPAATEQELLLDAPAGMAARTRAMLKPALVQLEPMLGSSDEADDIALFRMAGNDPSGLPKRRGYYLGYLVAQQAAKQHPLQELAKLDCNAARIVVYSAVQQLTSDAAKMP